MIPSTDQSPDEHATDDRTRDDEHAIERLLHSVAYVLDSHEYRRMGEVFADDVEFSNPGRLEAAGLPAVRSAFEAIANPARSHHVTNVVVTITGANTATAVSKAITIRADGEVAPAEYRDEVTRTAAGWRISARRIRPL